MGANVSDSDSFIREVSEEVRRDKLFALLRRYGGFAVALVVLIVGGAAYNEWRKAQETARARAFGDSVLTVLENNDPTERAEAFVGIAPAAAADADILLTLLTLLEAAERIDADDRDGAAEAYGRVADGADAPRLYRDIAELKRIVLLGSELPADERRRILNGLAAPGAPFRLLAEEQLALIEVESGENSAAITRLKAIVADAEVTPGLRDRASSLILALGGRPEAA